MNIPGSFTWVDVDFNRSTEPALLLDQSAGFAVLTYGPNFPGANATTGVTGGTTYTTVIDVDAPGGAVTVNALGSTILTFTALLSVLNTALTGVATVTLKDNNVVITSLTSGTASAISVVDDPTFPLFASIKGHTFGLTNYQTTRGNDRYLARNRLSTSQIAAVDAVLQFADPADTEWTNATDTVVVTGTGIVPTSQMGVATGTYTLNIAVDSATAIDVSVAVAGTDVTFAGFVANLNTAVGLAIPGTTATLTAATNTITINIISPTVGYTTAVPAVASSVAVIEGVTGTGLIATLDAATSALPTAALAAAVGAATTGIGSAGTGLPNGNTAGLPVQPQTRGSLYYDTTVKILYWSDGAAWVKVGYFAALPTTFQVLSTVPYLTGFGPLYTAGSACVFEKENKPQAKGNAVLAYVYWDGSAWKYYNNDATIGSTVNPPTPA